ncbi:MAG: SUMF1/EgtB/PvdO family nonheme iron enzyme [Myxococcales bacterium]|nr:SUMF1/EgtB/PvdO family nonheme iron enzyme [Myxococcota bacterium]MDW8283375.1 SUMF1/EgtB/PvdO family nonheme iron enzyme [Myxococcales bacterium]
METRQSKRCFQCGATYPSEELACQLDETPLCYDTIARRWRVEEVLARRPGGGVFAAFHLVTGARAAIDFLPWPLTEDHAVAGRLNREVQALRLLSQLPGVPQLMETGTERDGSRFVVTALGDGRPLAELMDQWRRPETDGPLVPPPRATQLVAPVLAALSSAHRLGIAHGQISPASIYVAQTLEGHPGETVLLHGLCAPLPGRTAASGLSPVASEVRADLNAMAALLHELLVGRPPPEDIAASASELNRQLGPKLASFLLRALQPGGGFASADEMARALFMIAPPPVPVTGPRLSRLMPLQPSHASVDSITQQVASLPLPLSPLQPIQKVGLTGELRQVSVADLLAGDGQKQESETLAVARHRPFTTAELMSVPAPSGGETTGTQAPTPLPPDTPPPAEPSFPEIEVVERDALSQVGGPMLEASPASALPVQEPGPSVRSVPPPGGLPMPPPSATTLRPVLLALPPVPPLATASCTSEYSPRRPASRISLVLPASPVFYALLGIATAVLLSAAVLLVVKRLRPRQPRGPAVAIQRLAPPTPLPRRQPALMGAAPPCPADMVGLPPAMLRLGSPEDEGRPDERPQHWVHISGFCMDRFEVRNADYRTCQRQALNPRLCPAVPRSAARRWRDPTWRNLPVVQVSHAQAAAYCAALGKRLPTEAEWEYAAAGIVGRRYPWGFEPPTCDRTAFAADPRSSGPYCQQVCRSDPRSECISLCLSAGQCAAGRKPGPLPVGSMPRNATPEGIYDLGGNIAEWVADYYADRYAEPETEPVLDPQGPAQGVDRVVRGGGWLNPAPLLRSRARDHLDPTLTDLVGVGFRCAASAEQARAILRHQAQVP